MNKYELAMFIVALLTLIVTALTLKKGKKKAYVVLRQYVGFNH